MKYVCKDCGCVHDDQTNNGHYEGVPCNECGGELKKEE